jgi:hypothetical protein
MYLHWACNFQILRDEEGKKLGLKPSEKTSGSDNDVKMVDVEVSNSFTLHEAISITFWFDQSTINWFCPAHP